MRVYRFTTALLVLVTCALPAWAHRPYLSHKVTWTGPDGKSWALARLNGDAVLAPPWIPDPDRPVVLNSEGNVVAIGPLNTEAVPVCYAPVDCRVLTTDGVLVPELETFGSPRPPDFRPEDSSVSTYGFKVGRVSLIERPQAYKAVLLSAPFQLLFLSLPLITLSLLASYRVAYHEKHHE